MTKEEFLNLRLGDYVYRDDGWIAKLNGAPGNRKIENWSDALTLFLEDKLIHPYDIEKYPTSLIAKDHDNWHKMAVGTCENPLALARYACLLNFGMYEELSRTTVL